MISVQDARTLSGLLLGPVDGDFCRTSWMAALDWCNDHDRCPVMASLIADALTAEDDDGEQAHMSLGRLDFQWIEVDCRLRISGRGVHPYWTIAVWKDTNRYGLILAWAGSPWGTQDAIREMIDHLPPESIRGIYAGCEKWRKGLGGNAFNAYLDSILDR